MTCYLPPTGWRCTRELGHEGPCAAVRVGTWRVGSKVPLNVYDGDRPVCQCHSAEDANRIVAAVNAQIEQAQTAPSNHISAHPPAPSDEVQELRSTSADWQKQFHQLESLCNERGLTVGYGHHGQVTLGEEPKQQRPGEDPNEICRCPACVAIRAKVRSKP